MMYGEARCRHGRFLDGDPPCEQCYQLRAPIFNAIRQERKRQDAKWGDQSGNAPTVWATVLAEEVGEAAQAALHVQFEHELTIADLRKELIEVAAVAVAWVEAIDLA